MLLAEEIDFCKACMSLTGLDRSSLCIDPN